jgi:ribosomal protein L29
MNSHTSISYHHGVVSSRSVLRAVVLLLLLSGWALAEAAEIKPLSETDITKLQTKLDEMKAHAPKLRIQLRKVHSQVEFDVRQVHGIERSISQAILTVQNEVL